MRTGKSFEFEVRLVPWESPISTPSPAAAAPSAQLRSRDAARAKRRLSDIVYPVYRPRFCWFVGAAPRRRFNYGCRIFMSSRRTYERAQVSRRVCTFAVWSGKAMMHVIEAQSVISLVKLNFIELTANERAEISDQSKPEWTQKYKFFQLSNPIRAFI